MKDQQLPPPTMPVVALTTLFEKEDILFCEPRDADISSFVTGAEPGVIFDRDFSAEPESAIAASHLRAILQALGLRGEFGFDAFRVTVFERVVDGPDGRVLAYEVILKAGAKARS